MGSSGIGASLQKLVGYAPRHLGCPGFLALFLVSTSGLAAQAPAREGPTSADLPRFTLRQIVAGHNDTLASIPPTWLKAARVAVPESAAVRAYRDAATRSGVVPLPGKILDSERSRHVMGLYQREELTAAIRGTLEAIRAALSSDSTRARFDRLFRSADGWVVDLHDAALAWARARAPTTRWDSARAALAATRWIPRGDTVPNDEAVPRALYSLAVLAAKDSGAFEVVRSDLWRADSVSAAAVLLLLAGYTESRKWYVDVLDFFLTQPWISDGRRGLSLGDLVRNYWLRGPDAAPGATPLPEIQTRLFGYPQALPHYGVPSQLFQLLVRPDNTSAHAWLDRHGQAGFLRAIRQLPAGDGNLLLLQHGRETIRLTSVPRQSRESLNGFLEPRDAITIDPGYSPLLALGAVVHEWQHLCFRRRQLEAYVARLHARPAAIVELPWVEPYLAEGFAEWSAEEIMASPAQRWPLLALGEVEKRAGLALAGDGDQHAEGYALVRALAGAVGSHAATTDLLLRHAEQPSRILTHPAVRTAWKAYGLARDRVAAVPAQRILIPEVTFTIEDGFPDVVSSRILVPPRRRGQP